MLITEVLPYKTLYQIELLVTASFEDWPTRDKDGLPKSHTEIRSVLVAGAPDGQHAITTALESVGETMRHVDPWNRRTIYEGRVTAKVVNRMNPQYVVTLGQEIVIHTGVE